MHLLANLALERMVLLCWLDGSMEIIVRLLTFVELVGVNMLAATNVAICVNLALIVRVSSPCLLAVVKVAYHV